MALVRISHFKLLNISFLFCKNLLVYRFVISLSIICHQERFLYCTRDTHTHTHTHTRAHTHVENKRKQNESEIMGPGKLINNPGGVTS